MDPNSIPLTDLHLTPSRSIPALTPDMESTATFAPLVSLDPLTPGGETDEVSIELAEELEHDTSSLKDTDVHGDPILSNLAKQQNQLSQTSKPLEHVKPAPSHAVTLDAAVPPATVTGFKARPAPTTTRAEGLGPKMTKSAALRMGLSWTVPERKREAGTSGDKARASEASNVPGYKREGLHLNIASLATPSMAPRATKSSQLRAGGSVTPAQNLVKRDPAAILAANQARLAEEKARRRASIAIPASLSAPSIAPRQNKSSALRAGLPMPPPTPSRALTATSAANLAAVPSKQDKVDVKKESLFRRASMGVKSLGAPSIAPRSNRSAMLRAGTPSIPTTKLPTPASAPVLSHRKSASVSIPTSTTYSAALVPRAPRASMVRTPTAPGPAPRPTKASLLRAGLGARLGM